MVERCGLDLSPLRTFSSNFLYGAHINEDAWLAAPSTLIDIDLLTNDSADAIGRAAFTTTRDGLCHGFGGWFEAAVAPEMPVMLTNRIPHETHWMQSFLPLEEAIPVTVGERIELELQSRNGRQWRWRGTVGEREFDQMTWLAAPPCAHSKK